MNTHAVRFTDASLTDGQNAVWSGAMSTPMRLDVIRRLDGAGLTAIEVSSPALFTQCLARGENPWQFIEAAREQCPQTVFRTTINLMTGHGKHGTDILSTDVATHWLKEFAAHGVQQVIVMDPLIAIARLAPVLQAARRLELSAIAALPFVEDAIYSDAWYGEQARALVMAGAARMMLRDESGLLTPDRVATLIPALKAALGDTPLDLHTRCHTALGPMVVLEALRLGVDGIDTALPSLANGASLPSITNLVRALSLIDIATNGLDMSVVRSANAVADDIAEREGFPRAECWVFDLAPYAHQLPGELAADLMRSLPDTGRNRHLNAFAVECDRIRRDMGTPPMVEPFATPIAEQAHLHVAGMPRYAQLRPGIRRLVQGIYGSLPGVVNAELQCRVGTFEVCKPATMEALRENTPGATDLARLTAHVSGFNIKNLPHPLPPAQLRYQTLSPFETLARGLLERLPHYASLRVKGPDMEIVYQQLEG
ncbi:hypothetical protein [Paraburkholderia sp. BL10I2N1]|uniref:hypothetical protein n=1 Tax=Paraburkholderia sp. BL10I2N1 TaxID=1938796 RepID=UPI001061F2D1|nr:hypothetical protein [Paraburkholderia sp. BL10I2N1]TDN58022.1 oxaloacetate decarboxylase alpha subunit [Paraburkholderia sp. BL10I2N1]